MRFTLIILVLLFAAHGLINALGFAAAWRLGDLPQLRGGTSLALSESGRRLIGLGWAAAALALVVGAVMAALGKPAWWVPSGVGLLLSQALVVGAWSVAKAGTIANAILLIPVVVGAATTRFHAQTDRAVADLLSRGRAAAIQGREPVTPDQLAPLPAPVRGWLQASGVVGRPRAHIVYLEQQGLMRTAVDQPWMPARARQRFTVDEPGFVWDVGVTMKRVLPILGRDSYRDGRGRMLILAAALVPVVDGQGAQIDQGTLLRFLGEIVWFPSAALAPYIRWTAVDDLSARATMTYAGVTGSAVFAFDPAGRPLRMTAQRYLGAGAGAKLERWEVTMRAWRPMGGALIPTEGSVTWKLAAGDFEYFRWEITNVAVDDPARALRHR